MAYRVLNVEWGCQEVLYGFLKVINRCIYIEICPSLLSTYLKSELFRAHRRRANGKADRGPKHRADKVPHPFDCWQRRQSHRYRANLAKCLTKRGFPEIRDPSVDPDTPQSLLEIPPTKHPWTMETPTYGVLPDLPLRLHLEDEDSVRLSEDF